MLSLRLGKQRGETIAVADIGSGSAGVAIVETTEHGPARILAAERGTLSFEERSQEATISGIIGQLEHAAQKALTTYSANKGKASKHVAKAYAILRSPWNHSRTILGVSQFAEETRIEKETISALAKETLKGDTGSDPSNVFETSVVRVQLNGYPTAEPKGKRAHNIALFILVSDCAPAIRSGVSETLSKIFACPPPTFRSGTRALLTVLRESALLPKECLVVNMTAQAVSLVVVRKGAVGETATLAEGSRSIVQRVAKDKMPEETLTLIRLLALDQCEAESCEVIKKALASVEPELVKIFGEAMSAMSSSRRLPNSLILAAPADLTPWLSRFLSRIDFAQFTSTTRPFLVRVLKEEDLATLVGYAEALKSDPGLSVASALVNIEEHAAHA